MAKVFRESISGTPEWETVLDMLVDDFGPGPPGADRTPWFFLYGAPPPNIIECGAIFSVEYAGYLFKCVSGQGIRDILRPPVN